MTSSRQGVPAPTSEAIRRRFERQKRVDTAPELALRSALWRAGLRYRVGYRVPGVRGSVDIAFTKAKVAVFVDGCFWHGCPEHGTSPKANGEWWAAKLASNRERDVRKSAQLTELGWTVLRFWEHEDVAAARSRVERTVTRTGPRARR